MSPNFPLDDALRSHLLRLALAGALSVSLGLVVAWRRPPFRPFGLMSAAWGAVDLVIAGLSSRDTHVPGDEVEGLIHFLILNLGFNCGYIAVGITMAALAGPRQGIRQSGVAVIVQGLVLLALDGYFANTMPFWLAPGWKG